MFCITLSSADSSVTITPSTTSGNVNFDLSVAANTPSRVTLTPLSIIGANNTFNPLYPALPGSGYPVATKQGILVSIQGSVELVSTGSFSLTNGVQIPLATLPAGYRPPAGTLSFLVTIFSKKTAPYQDPDSAPIIGRITIDTGGTVILIPYPIFPPASSLFTASMRAEIDLSQIQYSVML
jgi:hypothetical protein